MLVQKMYVEQMFETCIHNYFYVSDFIMSASTTSLVGVLKKKMLDTKEEVERVKEQIQDMASAMEVR